MERVKRLVINWLERSRGSLYYFSKVILGFKDIDYGTHYKLCKLLEGCGRNKLILMPRGTFKTTIIGISYPLWYLLFKDSDARILVVSDTYNNAVKIIFKIKDIIESNERLKLLFGDLKGRRWREDEIDIGLRRNYSKEPSICCGTQDVTRVGQHYDIIICDDIVTDVNTQTEEQMRKTVEYFKSLYSILEPDGVMIVNGTRWSYNRWELYQYILDNLRDKFEVYIEKAIRDDGSLFFPSRYNKEKLDEILSLVGSYQFSAQYLNNPINPLDTRLGNVITFDDITSVLNKRMNICMTVDPAISLSDDADYTGIVICGMDSLENIYVLEALRCKLLPDKLIDTIFYLHKKWGCNWVGIESVAFQKSLKYYLEKEEYRRNYRLNLIELRPDNNKNKFMRIMSLQPYIERRQLLVYDKLTELLSELYTYPRSTHDDLVDALSYQLQILIPYKDNSTGDGLEYTTLSDLRKKGYISRFLRLRKVRNDINEDIFYYEY